ncbi:MAG: [FeFe] hydrogenase H-cluster maturation GTPase HydF [Lachnospiraceae bacterium]|nr:[FeFe] hydrogenase H-cluster maturation GTPase HydF [Lachnospiraceae bacterium]
MSLNNTPSSERLLIGFFGCRNAGKSSLVNAVTGQPLSVVSDVRGTTTDPVRKAMELLPVGPVVIADTPGFDDEGDLGGLRVGKTKEILRRTDVAVLVTDAVLGMQPEDRQLLELIKERDIPCLIARNKCDLLEDIPEAGPGEIYVSALRGINIWELKEELARIASKKESQRRLIGDLVAENSTVVLVCPIDESAPKGRLILPQQLAIRDLLDQGALPYITRDTELKSALASLREPPAMVVTDSQVFRAVSGIVPEEIPLTSFSILMARYKGFLKSAVQGALAVDTLKDGDCVLLAEGCTHHRQCNDIGTVKIPRWLRAHTNADITIRTCSGLDFPEDLSPFALVVHCGGCMLNEREVLHRMHLAGRQQVPFTNYGIAIARMTGILERSVRIFPDIAGLL